jgi:hypothetical protein
VSDIQRLIEMLKSENPNKRYYACEELRVSRQPLPQEAIDGLKFAANDSNLDVADAAKRALALHISHPQMDEVVEDKKDKLITDHVKINKGRDTVIGFFGWAIFHNLYFLILIGTFGTNSSRSNVWEILPFLIGLSLVIFTKRVWIGVGSAIVILISTLIWISYGLPILISFWLPFPVGMFLFMS